MDSIAGMQLLIIIVEEGSFAGAARRLSLTPSAVSRKLADFEQELGVSLFRRTTRKLSLTESGELLFNKARGIVAEVEQVKSELTRLGNTPSGSLRVTAPSAFGRLIIAPMLTEFFERYPNIEIGLSLNDLYHDVVGEGFDLAIRQWEPTDSNLRASHLADIDIIMCASPAYLQKYGYAKTIQELSTHNCLTYRSQTGANRWQFYDRQGAIESINAQGNFYSDDIGALLSAALSGQGVIRSANWLVEEHLQSGQLCKVLAEIPTYPKRKGIYALYSEQRLLPPKARVFIDFLKEKFLLERWNKVSHIE